MLRADFLRSHLWYIYKLVRNGASTENVTQSELPAIIQPPIFPVSIRLVSSVVVALLGSLGLGVAWVVPVLVGYCAYSCQFCDPDMKVEEIGVAEEEKDMGGSEGERVD